MPHAKPRVHDCNRGETRSPRPPSNSVGIPERGYLARPEQLQMHQSFDPAILLAEVNPARAGKS